MIRECVNSDFFQDEDESEMEDIWCPRVDYTLSAQLLQRVWKTPPGFSKSQWERSRQQNQARMDRQAGKKFQFAPVLVSEAGGKLAAAETALPE